MHEGKKVYRCPICKTCFAEASKLNFKFGLCHVQEMKELIQVQSSLHQKVHEGIEFNLPLKSVADTDFDC